MLCGNENAIESFINLFNHQNIALVNNSSVLKTIEENMASLDLSGLAQTHERDRKPNHLPKVVGTGDRIMRKVRRNSIYITPKSFEDEPPKEKKLQSKAIEKIYLNKALGRLKHTQLETIYEHEVETDANENQNFEESKAFGKRKIKRSVLCSDGFNTTKTLKQKRKRRIQKIFGVHKKLKSISMEKFLERLQVTNLVDISKK